MERSLSVIVITWNAEKDVKPCLRSIMESTEEIPTEIIVVDNGSTDATIRLLEEFGETVKITQLKENRGVAAARNIALKQTSNEVVWILDVDTIVNRKAAETMVDYIVGHEECGLCACKLTDAEGNVQESCRKLPWPKYKVLNWLAAPQRKKHFPKKISDWISIQNEEQFYHKELSMETPFSVEYTIGACQMFRREIIDEIGYLDEKIFYGPEDADFCQRITEKGKHIVVLPQVKIIHHYNRLSQKKLLSQTTWKHLKGLAHFYLKQRGTKR